MSNTGPWGWTYNTLANKAYVFRENKEFPDHKEVIECRSKGEAIRKCGVLNSIDGWDPVLSQLPPYGIFGGDKEHKDALVKHIESMPPASDWVPEHPDSLVTLTLISAVEDTLAACPLCSGTGTRQGAPCWKCDRLRTSLKDFKAQ